MLKSWTRSQAIPLRRFRKPFFKRAFYGDSSTSGNHTPLLYGKNLKELHPSPSKEAVKIENEVSKQLLQKNRMWAEKIWFTNPKFFKLMKDGQQPKFFYLGCCDSRVPAEQVLGLGPGDVFVYRNIANLAQDQDIGVQSALKYAIEILKIEHILICGHYGFGGVLAAAGPPKSELGVVEVWIQGVRDSIVKHKEELKAITDQTSRERRIVEINVIEQCINIYRNESFQLAQKGTAAGGIPLPQIHPLVYDFGTGSLKVLSVDWSSVLGDG